MQPINSDLTKISTTLEEIRVRAIWYKEEAHIHAAQGSYSAHADLAQSRRNELISQLEKIKALKPEFPMIPHVEGALVRYSWSLDHNEGGPITLFQEGCLLVNTYVAKKTSQNFDFIENEETSLPPNDSLTSEEVTRLTPLYVRVLTAGAAQCRFNFHKLTLDDLKIHQKNVLDCRAFLKQLARFSKDNITAKAVLNVYGETFLEYENRASMLSYSLGQA